MKRPALQNKQVALLRMAFWAREVLGTFEKRVPLGSVSPKSRELFGPISTYNGNCGTHRTFTVAFSENSSLHRKNEVYVS